MGGAECCEQRQRQDGMAEQLLGTRITEHSARWEKAQAPQICQQRDQQVSNPCAEEVGLQTGKRPRWMAGSEPRTGSEIREKCWIGQSLEKFCVLGLSRQWYLLL